MQAQDLPPPLLEVRQLHKTYPLPRRQLWGLAAQLQALHDVSFSLHVGRSLGVVGESGSGKSTLARLVMALDTPTSGQVLLHGQDLHALPAAQLRSLRPQMQMVFQDPYSALNPRLPIGRSVAEPLSALPPIAADEQQERVVQALAQVGLHADDARRYPHAFSGGQRQRIAIARAIITRPQLVVADEPVSALDVSVQAQVLNVLQELQRSHGMSYLFISHDLSVVHHLCDEIMVLHQGQVVESGPSHQLLRAAKDPYTRALLAAVPSITPGAARARRAMRLQNQAAAQPAQAAPKL
ncbi:MAG: ABC transporter ATP-binding protein [Comamonas sp.]|nr:ABC transporter ATP-binding protein [Comamonas sp.]